MDASAFSRWPMRCFASPEIGGLRRFVGPSAASCAMWQEHRCDRCELAREDSRAQGSQVQRGGRHGGSRARALTERKRHCTLDRLGRAPRVVPPGIVDQENRATENQMLLSDATACQKPTVLLTHPDRNTQNRLYQVFVETRAI